MDPNSPDAEDRGGPSKLGILRATFDALPSSVAVVSPEGNVVMVNESWRRFAHEGRLPWPSAGLGSPFLWLIRELCRRNPLRLQELARGLGEVREGRVPRFDIELPLRIGGVNRWNGLTVTRFVGEEVLLVVTRREITERRLTEQVSEILQALTRRLGNDLSLAEATPIALEAICHLLEWSAAEPSSGSSSAGSVRYVAGFYPQGPDGLGWRALARLVRERTELIDQALTGGVLCCEDAFDERFKGALPPGTEALELRGAVGLPILREGKVEGVMLFLHRCSDPPSEDARLLLATVAARIGRMLRS